MSYSNDLGRLAIYIGYILYIFNRFNCKLSLRLINTRYFNKFFNFAAIILSY
jgi:hypothetical protein